MFNFDHEVDRRGTGSLKWDKYAGRDVIPLWVADMDFASPPAVLEALRERLDHGVFGYTGAPGELVEVIRERLLDLYGWRIEADWLVWLPGLVTGLNVACRAVGEEGDEVLTHVPIYPPFLSAPELSSRRTVRVPLVETGGRWVIDFDHLEQAITPRSRLFLLCNPQNPTGRVFSREELEGIAAFCERHGLILCSDEIHCDLILDPACRHLPTAGLDPSVAARTITLMAPSKTFNLPGLGCSFAIISDPVLRQRFRRVMAGIVPYVNLFGYAAALAAYRDGGPWLSALIEYLRGNRDLVREAVAAMPGLSMTPVEATYLAWIDARRLQLTDPAAFFDDAGVGLSDGREFGMPGFLRLNFGCPRPLLRRGLERMARAVAGLASSVGESR
ncbi:MAG: PatB family C-S lyase [Syntrophotaleaceae bacterium]